MKLFTRKQAPPDCEWRPDGLVDLAVQFSIAYFRPDRPDALVLVWFSATECPHGSGLYAVERLTEYIVGDPRDRDNATWIEQHRDLLGGSVPDFRDAVLAARDNARETYANGYPIDWDGLPGWGEA